MNKTEFWFAYGLDKAKKSALRLYRYINGAMQRKQKDGSWDDAPEQCCIFFGEDMEYTEITKEDAEAIKVRG